ncbi:dystrotelin-like [Neocloeon triangulifer]|uniref:dystrotelin-like n=1 Tax=Neocloeon triangulifer TaxID=2078957 RepID=UPI00286F7C16|nr:dystrotelin-like [Neocloeon triangulifer]
MLEWSGREDAQGFSIFVRADCRRYEPPGWSDVVTKVRQCQELRGVHRRTAAKLKVLSDAISWSDVRLDVFRLVLEHHGFRREDNSMLLSPTALRAVLEDVFFALSREKALDVEMAAELTACLLWQAFDRHRTGCLTLLQAKTTLAILSRAFPSELFAYLAHEAADHDGQVGPLRMKPLLEAVRVFMKAVGEDVASLEFKERRINHVEAEEWMKARMGWAAHLARFRVNLREIWHGPCVVCKQTGLQGQAFLCQSCPWYWVCRRCVLSGKYTYGHQPSHPLKDFVTPPNVIVEVMKAGGRVMKKAFSHKRRQSKQKFTEPVGLRLQSSAEQWENLQEASRALEDHGQRLQALGLRLTGLTTEHQITSTPKSCASSRSLEMSPIAGPDTTLEFSTVLQKRLSVSAESRAPVTAALDKLQAMLATSTALEESFGDNEQLERAAQELESLLGGVIAGIEGHKRP